MTDNQERAERAFRVLLVYCQYKGEKYSCNEPCVRDLIADLGHYCAESGIDFQAEVESGVNHFEAETAEAVQL